MKHCHSPLVQQSTNRDGCLITHNIGFSGDVVGTQKNSLDVAVLLSKDFSFFAESWAR